MKASSSSLFEDRKLKDLPRAERPRCGARTRTGGTCKAQALRNKAGRPGRCRMHGGLSTGPKTEAGIAATCERARQQMRARWAQYRAEGSNCVPLSDAARERIREAARRTMRLRHRKREALEWADWLLEQNTDYSIRLWEDRRKRVILEPYKAAAECGGLQQLFELADLAGIELRSLESGAELTAAILGKYAPRFDIREAANDLRRSAGG